MERSAEKSDCAFSVRAVRRTNPVGAGNSPAFQHRQENRGVFPRPGLSAGPVLFGTRFGR